MAVATPVQEKTTRQDPFAEKVETTKKKVKRRQGADRPASDGAAALAARSAGY